MASRRMRQPAPHSCANYGTTCLGLPTPRGKDATSPSIRSNCTRHRVLVPQIIREPLSSCQMLLIFFSGGPRHANSPVLSGCQRRAVSHPTSRDPFRDLCSHARVCGARKTDPRLCPTPGLTHFPVIVQLRGRPENPPPTAHTGAFPATFLHLPLALFLFAWYHVHSVGRGWGVS